MECCPVVARWLLRSQRPKQMGPGNAGPILIMITRMTHPEHGFTDAYDTAEVQRLQVHGWYVQADELPEVEDPEQPDQPAKRRGRPPKAQ